MAGTTLGTPQLVQHRHGINTGSARPIRSACSTIAAVISNVCQRHAATGIPPSASATGVSYHKRICTHQRVCRWNPDRYNVPMPTLIAALIVALLALAPLTATPTTSPPPMAPPRSTSGHLTGGGSSSADSAHFSGWHVSAPVHHERLHWPHRTNSSTLQAPPPAMMRSKCWPATPMTATPNGAALVGGGGRCLQSDWPNCRRAVWLWRRDRRRSPVASHHAAPNPEPTTSQRLGITINHQCHRFRIRSTERHWTSRPV